MSKFRKKPVVIEAFQWDGTISSTDAIQRWAGTEPKPDGPAGAAATYRCRIEQPRQFGPLLVHTLEGDVSAQKGDWIIKGVNGEFYPCKPDIFEKTYEPENVDKTCPCGAQLIQNGLVVKSHWNGAICEDCEAMIFEKHRLGTEDQKMLLLSNEVIAHINTQYNLRYEELSEESWRDYGESDGMSIPEKHQRSCDAARKSLRHYFRTGKFVHWKDAEPHLTKAAT